MDEKEQQRGKTVSDLPWYAHRKRLRTSAENAEWFAPDNRLGGLIHQQRNRGHSAATRSNWLFFLLFLVVAFSLGYYLGLPIWQQLQDGTKRSLEAEVSQIDVQLGEIQEQRDSAWEHLLKSARLVGRPIPFRDDNSAPPTVFSTMGGQRVVAIYDDRIVHYTDNVGDSWEQTELPFPDGGFWGSPIAPYSTRHPEELIVFSSPLEPAMEKSRPLSFPAWYTEDGGLSWQASVHPPDITEGINATWIEEHGPVILLHFERQVVRSSDYGKTWNFVDVKVDPQSMGRISVEGEVWHSLASGVIVYSLDQGQSWDKLPMPPQWGENRLSITEASDDFRSLTIKIFHKDDFSLIGTFKTTNGGEEWVDITKDDNFIPDPPSDIPTPPLVNEHERSFSLNERAFTASFDGESVRILGGSELIQKIDALEANLTDAFWTNGKDIAIFAYGSLGRRLHFAGTFDGGQSWSPFSAIDEELELENIAFSPSNGALLAWGTSSAMTRFDDFYYRQLTASPLGDAQAKGQEIQNRLREVVPEEVLADPVLQPRISEVFSAVEGRDQLIANRAQRQREADQIAGTGFSFEQRAREFSSFMELCSGPLEKCMDTFFLLERSDDQGIWRYVAERTPPAILILFLLATLGGLYRYNLRLSGFHHSRADALELLHVMYGDGVTLAKEEIVSFTALADQMAADKVEFGKSKVPTEYAVELARAIAQRK